MSLHRNHHSREQLSERLCVRAKSGDTQLPQVAAGIALHMGVAVLEDIVAGNVTWDAVTRIQPTESQVLGVVKAAVALHEKFEIVSSIEIAMKLNNPDVIDKVTRRALSGGISVTQTAIAHFALGMTDGSLGSLPPVQNTRRAPKTPDYEREELGFVSRFLRPANRLRKGSAAFRPEVCALSGMWQAALKASCSDEGLAISNPYRETISNIRRGSPRAIEVQLGQIRAARDVAQNLRPVLVGGIMKAAPDIHGTTGVSIDDETANHFVTDIFVGTVMEPSDTYPIDGLTTLERMGTLAERL